MDQRFHAGDSDAACRNVRSDRQLEAQERFGLVMVTLFEILLSVAIVALVVALLATSGCERVVEPTFEDDPVTWDPSRFPLSVTYEADFDPDDVHAGADFWNRGACPLFEVIGAGDHGDVVIEVGDDVAQDSYGGWGIRTCPAGMCGIVYVRQSSFETGPAIIVAHELGHLLGLAHDTTQNRSIMHPQAASQIGYINVTDKDRAALGEMYCR